MWIAIAISAIVIFFKRKNKTKGQNTTVNLLIIMFALTFIKTGYAQTGTYTVGGTLNLSTRKGTVYIYLVDEEKFPIPFTGVKEQKFIVTKSILEYKFENVKQGEYAIRCFQDLNGNQNWTKECSDQKNLMD